MERNEEICHVKLKIKGPGKWQRDRKGAGGKKNRGGEGGGWMKKEERVIKINKNKK